MKGTRAIERVAIVGAGFSGTLQALNLLRHDGPAAILIERAGEAGCGVAFGAADPGHLLNVRAANMSAFPDAADHFVRWLEGRGTIGAAPTFVPRLVYGEYLREMLTAARNAAPDRLAVIHGEVVDLIEGDAAAGEGVEIRLADGRRIAADAAVLAVGNLPPHDPPGLTDGALPCDRYRGDPWARDVAKDLRDDDTVLLLGTGLTMVDVALSLAARGFGGRIVALSRRGLLPRAHAPAHPPAERLKERPRQSVAQLLARVRGRARQIGWRDAVDELRPFTQAMWAAAAPAERARFMRHLRPWWDVHRHRLAPPVADRLAALVAEGRLTVVAGKTLAFAGDGEGVAVDWRARGEDRVERMHVRRAINCTGPFGDVSRTREPLLRALLDRGAIRPDGARLGIDVDCDAAIIGRDGQASRQLFAVGPMTRGAFWEIVAVPDIRAQSWSLARRLSNAHWVGGEGL